MEVIAIIFFCYIVLTRETIVADEDRTDQSTPAIDIHRGTAKWKYPAQARGEATCISRFQCSYLVPWVLTNAKITHFQTQIVQEHVRTIYAWGDLVVRGAYHWMAKGNLQLPSA